MTKKIIISAFVALFATAASANNVFSKLDIDANGSLNQQEASYMPALGSQWDALDSDKSGELSAKEFDEFKADKTASSHAVEQKATTSPAK